MFCKILVYLSVSRDSLLLTSLWIYVQIMPRARPDKDTPSIS